MACRNCQKFWVLVIVAGVVGFLVASVRRTLPPFFPPPSI